MARIMQIVNSEETADWCKAFCLAGAVFMWVIAFAVLVGCSPEGDIRFISVPNSLTEVQRAAVQDAVDQWCAADGFCPTVIGERPGERAQGEVLLDTAAAYEHMNREPNSGAFTHAATHTITINEDHDGPEMFWLVIAHELGHLHGVKHHGGPECTMFWTHSEPSYTLACE